MNVDEIMLDQNVAEEHKKPTNTPRNCAECGDVFLATKARYCGNCQLAVAVLFTEATRKYMRWGTLQTEKDDV